MTEATETTPVTRAPAGSGAPVLEFADVSKTFADGTYAQQGFGSAEPCKYEFEFAEYAVQTMIDDGLLSNGPDATLGDFDMDRVNGLIEKAIPVYTAMGLAPPDGLTAEDIVTNESIDETIGL